MKNEELKMKSGEIVNHKVYGTGKVVRTFPYTEINPESDDKTIMANVDFEEFGEMDVILNDLVGYEGEVE